MFFGGFLSSLQAPNWSPKVLELGDADLVVVEIHLGHVPAEAVHRVLAILSWDSVYLQF